MEMKRFFLILVKVFLIEGLLFLPLKANFSVKTTKDIKLNEDNEIIARVEDKSSQMIKGMFNLTPMNDGVKMDITWTTLMERGGGKRELNTLHSSINLSKKEEELKRNTKILVLGTLEEEEELEDEEAISLGDSGDEINLADQGSTNIGEGVNEAISNAPGPSDVEKVRYISTYDGCEHIYKQEEETIDVYQRIYYLDTNGQEVEKDPCGFLKNVVAQRQECKNYDDFENHMTYEREQAYFEENEEIYSAGGCFTIASYPHQLDYNSCEAVLVPDTETYIKQGKWYYRNDKGEQIYISNCIIDPEGEEEDLLVEFDGCSVTHNIEENYSLYLGKYYWIKPDLTKEYLSDCVETNSSIFPHLMRWDGEFEHNMEDDYSQKILIRYIEIETENRTEDIQDELDEERFPHTFVWNNEQWEHNNQEHYSQRVMFRMLVIEQEGINETLQDDYIEPEHHEHLEKAVDNIWKNYDDLTPKGVELNGNDIDCYNCDGPKGYSTKQYIHIIQYDNKDYTTNENEYEGNNNNHTYIETFPTTGKSCGFGHGSRTYLKDKFKRPDSTIYNSNEYEEKCG